MQEAGEVRLEVGLEVWAIRDMRTEEGKPGPGETGVLSPPSLAGGFQKLPLPQKEDADTWRLQRGWGVLSTVTEGDEGTGTSGGASTWPGLSSELEVDPQTGSRDGCRLKRKVLTAEAAQAPPCCLSGPWAPTVHWGAAKGPEAEGA